MKNKQIDPQRINVNVRLSFPVEENKKQIEERKKAHTRKKVEK